MNDKLKEVEKAITITRNVLYSLIENNKNLNKPEIVKASQALDQMLNQYNQMIKEIENKP